MYSEFVTACYHLAVRPFDIQGEGVFLCENKTLHGSEGAWWCTDLCLDALE